MNKTELVNLLAEKTNTEETECRVLVDSFLDIIADAMERNEKVAFHKFGNFYTLEQNSRPVRNPRTGEPALLTPRVTVRFRPGSGLLKKLNPTLSPED